MNLTTACELNEERPPRLRRGFCLAAYELDRNFEKGGGAGTTGEGRGAGEASAVVACDVTKKEERWSVGNGRADGGDVS